MGAAVLRGKPLANAAHVLAVAGTVMVLVWILKFRGGMAWEAEDKALIFNLHPVITLIGYIILGGQATIAYKSLPWKKQQNKVIHMVFHFLALILGILGIYTAFKFHNEAGIANLYSFHSWLGLAAIVLYAIQWMYGFVIFFYPGGNTSQRSESLPWHVLAGMLIYSLAVAAAVLGFMEKITFLETGGIAKYGPEAFLVNFTAATIVLYGAFVIFAAYGKGNTPPGVDDFSYTAI